MSNRTRLWCISPTGLVNRTRSILRKNNVSHAVGGLDFSFNEDARAVFTSHWCAHLWLLLPSTTRKNWEPALRAANPPSLQVPRPVKIKDWDGRTEALAYALKSEFKRRVSVMIRDTRNTSEQRLRVKERIALYRYLNAISLADRIFLLGARPTMTEHGFSFVRLNSRKSVPPSPSASGSRNSPQMRQKNGNSA
jgi:hypothetical protein